MTAFLVNYVAWISGQLGQKWWFFLALANFLASLLFYYSYFRKNWVKERGNKSIFSYILTAAGTIDCFECNSWDDPRCHDPFNYTIHKEHMPPIVECEGCCVKMVQFIGTGKLCTTRAKILPGNPRVPIR